MTTGPSETLTPHSATGADPENLARSCSMRRSCDGYHASAGPEYIIDNQRRAAANLRRDDKLIRRFVQERWGWELPGGLIDEGRRAI